MTDTGRRLAAVWMAMLPCAAMADPGGLAPAGIAGAAWSMDLANAPLRSVVDQLALACGLALDYDRRVPTERRMSVSAHNGDPDLTLHYVLRANGLALQPVAPRAMRVVPGGDVEDAGAVAIGTASLMVDVAGDDAARQVHVPAPASAAGAARLAAHAPYADHAPHAEHAAHAGHAALASHVAYAIHAVPATPAPHGSGAQLDWKIRPRTRVGSNFTVQVFLRSVRPVSSVPLTIAYDHDALEVVRVEAGDYLGAQPQLTSQVSAGGIITLLAARTTASAGNDKAGLLASVTFRANRSSEAASIQVIAARVLDASGAELPTVIPFRHSMPVQP